MSLYTLQPKDLADLGPDRAVEFFRRLLWAEAGRTGIGKHLINVPQCINVGDGGIDALIKDVHPSKDDLIPAGTSGFQIKSSDLSPSDCKKELHIDGNVTKPLKPEIRRLMDQDATYVLVLFADLPNTSIRRRESSIREELTKNGYSNLKLRLYTANQLVGFVECFPGLVAWFKNDTNYCLAYSAWSERRDINTPRNFIFDDERTKRLAELRLALRECDDRCPIFRIIALSGIGKTRFVFELLSEDDLKNRVAYVTADQFRLSPLLNVIQNDSNLSVILVIDECNLEQHEEFVRAFAGRGSRLAVITISDEMGRVSQPSLLYRLEPLAKDSIEKMLRAESPLLLNDVVRRLSEFADGYPKIALLLSESYLGDKPVPDDFIAVNDDALMNRLIAGKTPATSDHFRKKKRALQWISLFTKIGWEGKLCEEAKWVADRAKVGWSDFEDTVAEEKKRGIIQGQYYIHVAPFALRIHLIREWWESHGLTKDNFSSFVRSIPPSIRPDLLERFFEHLPFISVTERGREFARAMLGPGGIFSDGELLKSKEGARFFFELTDADPQSAVNCLTATVGTWSKEELLGLTKGRRYIVNSLEKIAVWRNLFQDAARILLSLGEAETERYANNASGIFVDLYSNAYGPVAPTEAPPEERLPILKEAFASDSKERRKLALNACARALAAQYFVRTVGAEYQGTRREPNLWTPRTYGEWFAAYRAIWGLLREKIETLPHEERDEAVKILLAHSTGLAAMGDFSQTVIETLEEFSEKPYVKKEALLAQVLNVLHFRGKELPEELKKRWEQLRDKLSGSGPASALRRYVGMDLLEDKFDEGGQYVDKAALEIPKLAEEAIVNREILIPELEWLVTDEAKRGLEFGYELGRRDQGFSFFLILRKKQEEAGKKGNLFFLGGYFRALWEANKDRWEEELDKLAQTNDMASWVPELTWRSGMTDRAAKRILSLAENGKIGLPHLRMFCFGTSVQALSEDTFQTWVRFVIASSEELAISIALALHYLYYVRKGFEHKLPDILTMEILTHKSLFEASRSNSCDTMDEYRWVEIGKLFISLYPKESLKLAEKMFEYFGKEGTILQPFHSHTHEVLNLIVFKYPEQAWKLITKYLGPPIDSRAFHIKTWLHESGLFSVNGEGKPILSPGVVWEWVDEDWGKRAPYLASFIPKSLCPDEGGFCWAREVLMRYGKEEEVRSALWGNVFSGFWVGSASSHHEQMKQSMLDFRKREKSPIVRKWVDEFISSLDIIIEQDRIGEERRGF